MALIDSVREGYAEHNVPLHLLLGLISLSRRMDVYLPPPPAGAPPVSEAPGGDPVLHALLGLISLRRTLLSAVEPIRQAHEAAQARPGPLAPAPPPARDLLR